MTSPVDSHMLRVFFYNYSTGVRNLNLNDSDIHAPPLVALIPLWQKVSIGVVLTIMIGSTLLGNVLVILAVVLEKKLRTFNNYFFASLGMADLIIATIVMPLAMLVQLNGGVWYYGKRTCDLFIFLDVSCCTASILNLCAISLNRYWSITSPLKYAAKQTCRRAAVMITVVWAASFLIACPPLFGWPQRSPAPHSCEHNQNYIYIFYSSMGSFYIPVMVLTIVYCRIYRVSKRGAKFRRETTVLPYIHGSSSANSMGKTIKLRHINSKLSMTDYETSYKNVLLSKNRKETTDGNQGFKTCKRIVRNKKDPIKNAERKTAKTLGLIMGAFCACWLPFFVMYLVMPFCKTCRIHPALEGAIVWLGYFNSTLNPIIYICCKPQFRDAFKKILCCYYIRHSSRVDDRRRQSYQAIVQLQRNSKITEGNTLKPPMTDRPSQASTMHSDIGSQVDYAGRRTSTITAMTMVKVDSRMANTKIQAETYTSSNSQSPDSIDIPRFIIGDEEQISSGDETIFMEIPEAQIPRIIKRVNPRSRDEVFKDITFELERLQENYVQNLLKVEQESLSTEEHILNCPSNSENIDYTDERLVHVQDSCLIDEKCDTAGETLRTKYIHQENTMHSQQCVTQDTYEANLFKTKKDDDNINENTSAELTFAVSSCDNVRTVNRTVGIMEHQFKISSSENHVVHKLTNGDQNGNQTSGKTKSITRLSENINRDDGVVHGNDHMMMLSNSNQINQDLGMLEGVSIIPNREGGEPSKHRGDRNITGNAVLINDDLADNQNITYNNQLDYDLQVLVHCKATDV